MGALPIVWERKMDQWWRTAKPSTTWQKGCWGRWETRKAGATIPGLTRWCSPKNQDRGPAQSKGVVAGQKRGQKCRCTSGWYDTYFHFCYHRNYKTMWYTMINWIMGSRRDGPRPRSTSTNAITTLSNIEQGQVVDPFGPNYMSYIINPTISSLGEIVSGLGPLSNSLITVNSISWKRQQSTTFALVMGEILAGLRHIVTSHFNTNYFSLIDIERVTVILWPRSTSVNISPTITRGIVARKTWPTSTTSAITRGRVSGILMPTSTTFNTYSINWGKVSGINRPMYMTFLSQKHLHAFFFRTFITTVMTVGWRMAGFTIPRS